MDICLIFQPDLKPYDPRNLCCRMPHTGKNIGFQYEKTYLNQAIDTVRTGALSVREAAQQFGVPRSTIHDRLSGRVSVSTTSPGKQTVFPKEAEDKLASSIKRQPAWLLVFQSSK